MVFRRIKLRRLCWQGLIYRGVVISCSMFFFWLLDGDSGRAVKLSVGWGAVNISLYYAYHYVWHRLVKLGAE